MTAFKIQQLAPMLAHHFVEEYKIEGAYYKNYYRTLKDKQVFLGDFRMLMGGRLHDSWITDLTVTEQHCRITLSDFVTHVFAESLVELKGLNMAEEQLFFSISLDFDLNSSVEYYTVNEDGELIETPPTELNEYLDEQILNLKSSRKLGILASTDSQKKVLLILNLKSAKVIFGQDEAWNQLFGNQFDEFYNRFKIMLQKGKYLADQSVCYELLECWSR